MGLVVERVGMGGLVPPWVWHQHTERYRFAAPLAAGRRVLDAACGTGHGTAVLAAAGAATTTGVDVSPQAVEAASGVHSSAGIVFRTGDVCALPFPDRAFDLYVSFETIEHLADPAPFVAEARRVLAAGGVFVCSTPNRAVTNPGTGLGDRPYNPFHVREFTAQELTAVLQRGFPTVEMLGQTPFSGVYVRSLGRAARWSPRLAVRLHQAVKLARAPCDRRLNHVPRPCPGGAEPEILVAVCRLPPDDQR